MHAQDTDPAARSAMYTQHSRVGTALFSKKCGLGRYGQRAAAGNKQQWKYPRVFVSSVHHFAERYVVSSDFKSSSSQAKNLGAFWGLLSFSIGLFITKKVVRTYSWSTQGNLSVPHCCGRSWKLFNFPRLYSVGVRVCSVGYEISSRAYRTIGCLYWRNRELP